MKKRRIQAEKPYIKKVSPVFWKECIKCKEQFKGHYGWKFMLTTINTDALLIEEVKDSYYICCDCAKTQEDAVLIRENLINRKLKASQRMFAGTFHPPAN